MLKDIDIQYVGSGSTADSIINIKGVPLVWVINGDCLYDLPIWPQYEEMFISSDQVIDISEQYPDHNGITIRFIKNGQILNELQTSEYFGSILLSNPLVLNLFDYPYGRYVMSPHAKFDGQEFIITNRDMSTLLKWAPGYEKE
jgi:hypothetical protein